MRTSNTPARWINFDQEMKFTLDVNSSQISSSIQLWPVSQLRRPREIPYLLLELLRRCNTGKPKPDRSYLEELNFMVWV